MQKNANKNRFLEKLRKISKMADAVTQDAIREEAQRAIKGKMDMMSDAKGNVILKRGPISIVVDASFIQELNSEVFGGKSTEAVPDIQEYSKENAKELANKLQEARKQKNLSREKAAELIGCSAGSLFLWESGRAVPTRKFYNDLVKFVG